MYWLDICLLAILGLGAILGFWSGLLMQIARLLCLGASVYATLAANAPVTAFVRERIAPDANESLVRGLAYVGVFLAVYIALFSLSRLLYRVVRATKLEMLDRLGGALLGMVKMALVLAPVCALMAFLSLPATDEWMAQSAIAPVLAKSMQIAAVAIPDAYKTQAEDSIEQVRGRLQNEAAGKALDLLKIENALKK